MNISIQVDLTYDVPEPCMALMQFCAANSEHQRVEGEVLKLKGDPKLHRLTAGDGVGERIWVQLKDNFECAYSASVSINRPKPSLGKMGSVELQYLPSEVVKYLLPSRYCPVIETNLFSETGITNLQGGSLIDAFADWISKNFTYDIAASDASTTAQQSFEQRRGVCRDYAHALISMARTIGIPARYASVYSPDVNPMDFHAVVEIYLENGWHMVDPTGMTVPQRTAIIGVGRDATDVAFLTSFGDMIFKFQQVQVVESDR